MFESCTRMGCLVAGFQGRNEAWWGFFFSLSLCSEHTQLCGYSLCCCSWGTQWCLGLSLGAGEPAWQASAQLTYCVTKFSSLCSSQAYVESRNWVITCRKDSWMFLY